MADQARVPAPRRFFVGGFSVCGALHERLKLPNQDAILWQQINPGGLPIILALSDGHGSRAHFRSAIGARLAVETALAICCDLAVAMDGMNLASVRYEAEARLPRVMVREWMLRVEGHFACNPITAGELDAAGIYAAEKLAGSEATAYGATLLFVVMTTRFAVVGQLGDGDILWVDTDGRTASAWDAIPRDSGDETASLCMVDAWRYFLVKVVPLREHARPPLILASTDGYGMSFASNAEFLRIGEDYLGMMREQGFAAVVASLPDFLLDATKHGSGDDVTLGFIRCSEPGDPDSGMVVT